VWVAKIGGGDNQFWEEERGKINWGRGKRRKEEGELGAHSGWRHSGTRRVSRLNLMQRKVTCSRDRKKDAHGKKAGTRLKVGTKWLEGGRKDGVSLAEEGGTSTLP